MADETNEIMENEATVLQFAAASNLSLADILYLIQGTGTDRDKKMTLEQLRDFLQELFSKIKVIGVGGNAELTNALLKLKNGTSETKVNTDGLEVNSGTEKAFFKVGSFGFESDDGANGQVDYDASSHSWVFNIACQFDEGITVYGDASVSGTVTANSVTATNGTFTNLLGETKFNTLKNGTKVQARDVEGTNVEGDKVKINDILKLPTYDSKEDLPSDAEAGDVAMVNYNSMLVMTYYTGVKWVSWNVIDL